LDGPGDDLVVCLQMAECMADADGPLHLNLGLPVCNLDAHLVSDRDGIRLKIGPPNLLFALWFQFAQAVSKGQANRCRQCKELFATGRNTNRRKGAEFCSIECKTKYHSLKRSL
jgi:hypothetical protein